MAVLILNAIMAAFFGIICSIADEFTECYEGTCYHKSGITLNWTNAVIYCIEVDAVLVSIHSSMENTFIQNYAQCSDDDPCWIGMSDDSNEGTMQWIDGTPVDYLNFALNQPDNTGGGEHWVEIWGDGEWNDNVLYNENFALCMRPAPTSHPTLAPVLPSVSPTVYPTVSPSVAPTSPAPTSYPTLSPVLPSVSPTVSPTVSPSVAPTSSAPTTNPTSVSPTISPTLSPSVAPTPLVSTLAISEFIIILSAVNVTSICVCLIICAICFWVLRRQVNGESHRLSRSGDSEHAAGEPVKSYEGIEITRVTEENDEVL